MPEAVRPLRIAFTFDSYSRGSREGFTTKELEELEFTNEHTIESIAQSLRKLGSVEMVDGVKALSHRLSSSPSKPAWDVVFNYSEGCKLIAGRASQIPALLEAWGIPCTFCDSATIALCIDKPKAKMICEHFKIPTSPFAVIPARSVWPAEGLHPLLCINQSPHAKELKQFPLFIKPSLTGSGNGVSNSNKIENQEQLLRLIDELGKQHPESSLLVERFLPGKEYTVGILGTGFDARVIGVCEMVFVKDGGTPPNKPFAINKNDPYFTQGVYGHINKAGWDMKCPNPWPKKLELTDPIAQDLAKVALDAWRALGCQDAGRIDLRMDNKDPTKAAPKFLEVNAIAGLTPAFSDLVQLAEQNGIDYDRLIAEIVDQTLKRFGVHRDLGIAGKECVGPKS